MKFHIVFRVLLGLASLLVIWSLFLPLWEIYLWAPQYPEGLSIQIWHNDVKGDVDIINGLNHYIGMKHIKPEMFPEFTFLKYIIVGFVIYGLSVAIIGNVKLLKVFCISTVVGGIVALADFFRWGYDYGHNLDPTAPINVPGMSYQPPVLGYKDLLNFRALSMPSTGGWIIVGVGVIAFVALFYHWFTHRKKKAPKLMLLLLPFALMQGIACSNSKPQIQFGQEDCDYCKMKIMDEKFGLALLTPKGRTYKFDDFHCYANYLKENKPEVKQTYVVTFDQPGELLEAEKSFFVKGPSVKSPMGSGVAFFVSDQKNSSVFPDKESDGTFDLLLHE